MAFLDWTRGAAALIMLHGHVYHAFAEKSAHESGAYVLSQFVGGMAPAAFLFLTGITLAFLMAGRERRGVSAGGRVLAALRRSGYLFGIAVLFRLELFATGLPDNRWTDLFKVDILNCMGLAILLFSPLAALAAEQRVRWGAILGTAVAGGAPLISALNWNWLHPFLRDYVVPDYNYFAFFPWAAFVAFGISAGTIVRLSGPMNLPRLMQWSALAGLALIAGGRYFSELPYSLYDKSEFWLNSPMLILIKLGVLLLALSFAYLWTAHGAGRRWSFVRQLGTTSLLVYWVHIELVYGRWFGAWKESLPVVLCAATAVLLIAAMVGLSLLRTRWPSVRAWLAAQSFRPPLTPERVSGD
ncbi:MAG: DUF1624 domain-containing protein [Acidobacteria bacterium]|nr:DUF1624 domain-containing protein [Acidobacteriota bacterium]